MVLIVSEGGDLQSIAST